MDKITEKHNAIRVIPGKSRKKDAAGKKNIWDEGWKAMKRLLEDPELSMAHCQGWKDWAENKLPGILPSVPDAELLAYYLAILEHLHSTVKPNLRPAHQKDTLNTSGTNAGILSRVDFLLGAILEGLQDIRKEDSFPYSLHSERSIKLLIAITEDCLTRDFGTSETHALLTRTLYHIAIDSKDRTGTDVMRQDRVLGFSKLGGLMFKARSTELVTGLIRLAHALLPETDPKAVGNNRDGRQKALQSLLLNHCSSDAFKSISKHLYGVKRLVPNVLCDIVNAMANEPSHAHPQAYNLTSLSVDDEDQMSSERTKKEGARGQLILYVDERGLSTELYDGEDEPSDSRFKLSGIENFSPGDADSGRFTFSYRSEYNDGVVLLVGLSVSPGQGERLCSQMAQMIEANKEHTSRTPQAVEGSRILAVTAVKGDREDNDEEANSDIGRQLTAAVQEAAQMVRETQGTEICGVNGVPLVDSGSSPAQPTHSAVQKGNLAPASRAGQSQTEKSRQSEDVRPAKVSVTLVESSTVNSVPSVGSTAPPKVTPSASTSDQTAQNRQQMHQNDSALGKSTISSKSKAKTTSSFKTPVARGQDLRGQASAVASKKDAKIPVAGKNLNRSGAEASGEAVKQQVTFAACTEIEPSAVASGSLDLSDGVIVVSDLVDIIADHLEFSPPTFSNEQLSNHVASASLSNAEVNNTPKTQAAALGPTTKVASRRSIKLRSPPMVIDLEEDNSSEAELAKYKQNENRSSRPTSAAQTSRTSRKKKNDNNVSEDLPDQATQHGIKHRSAGREEEQGTKSYPVSERKRKRSPSLSEPAAEEIQKTSKRARRTHSQMSNTVVSNDGPMKRGKTVADNGESPMLSASTSHSMGVAQAAVDIGAMMAMSEHMSSLHKLFIHSQLQSRSLCADNVERRAKRRLEELAQGIVTELRADTVKAIDTVMDDYPRVEEAHNGIISNLRKWAADGEGREKALNDCATVNKVWPDIVFV